MSTTREELNRFIGDINITLSTTPQMKAFIKQLIADNPDYAGLPVKSATLLLIIERLDDIYPGLLDDE